MSENEESTMLSASLTSHWTAVGNVTSLLFAVAGAVSWTQGYAVVSVALWAVDFSLITATSIHAYLKPLRDVRDNFNRTVLALLGGEADQQVAQTLIRAQHPLPLVMDMCRPIVRRTLAVQLSRPITTSQLQLKYEVDRIEDDTLGKSSEVMRVNWNHHWFSIAPSKITKLSDLVLPLFICEYTALGVRGIKKLERDGKIELLWPVPSWLDDEPNQDQLRNEVRKRAWYTSKDLRINGDPMIAFMSHSTDEAEIERVLIAASKGAISEDTAKEFARRCMSVHFVSLDHDLEGEKATDGFLFQIQQKSDFWVWVKGPRPQQILYQYQISFDRPAFVRSIQFGLTTGDGNGSSDSAGAVSQRWCLLPPVVQSAFDLLDETPRYNPKDQALEWHSTAVENGASSDTPFIPGHGVTFIWRSRDPLREPEPVRPIEARPMAQA